MSRRYLLIIAFGLIATFGLQTALAPLALARSKVARESKPKKESIENVPAEDIRTNPHAPPDYDPNLAVNDLAVSFYLEPVRILAKSGGAYQVKTTVAPIVTYWFRANSIYPYFDRHEFWLTLKKYEEQVKVFLGCYAEKNRLELKKVSDANYRPNAGTTVNFIKVFKAASDKLAQLEVELKSKLQNRPNTFLQFDKNPAIIEDIAIHRKEYLQCLVAKEVDRGLEIHLSHPLSEIAKAKAQAEQFKVGQSEQLYSIGIKDWGLLAVSPRARQEYLNNFKGLQELVEVVKATGNDPFARLNAAFDDLKTALSTKLSLYKPSASPFRFRDPAAERILLGKLGDPATYTLYRRGVEESGWLIEKNEFGIPRSRWKHVNAYLRYKNDDHPYCRLVTVYVYQEYAGGGTYNSTLIGSSPNPRLCGCP
jgi:hypothetical protein